MTLVSTHSHRPNKRHYSPPLLLALIYFFCGTNSSFGEKESTKHIEH